MKLLAITFTALVAFATVNCHNLPDFGEGQLHEDIQYFLDLIPMKKVAKVILQYSAKDAEFQALLRHFKTQDFKTMMKQIEAIPEFRYFADYLQKNGVYVYQLLNRLNKVIDIPPFQQQLVQSEPITGGLKGLFIDVKKLVSYDAFIHGYVFKMRVSDAFRGFVAELKSEGNQRFVNTLYENTNFLLFRGMVARKGVDLSLIEDVLYIVLGIEFPIFNTPDVFALYDNELSRDIHDFTDLIDKKKIVNIVLSYLDDDEVQVALEYMYSEEFHVLVRKVEALPEYQHLVNYLQDAGLDMYDLLNKVHKMFGMEDYVPPTGNAKQLSLVHIYTNRGGIKALVDEVIAALPLDKFKALYEQKMQTSPAFRTFIEKLRSDEFQKIVNTIYESPLFLEMRQKVINAGINLEPIRRVIEGMLGIKLPRPAGI